MKGALIKMGFMFIAICVLLGCVKNIKILKADIDNKYGRRLTIAIESDIVVSDYDESYWAEEVYLNYVLVNMKDKDFYDYIKSLDKPPGMFTAERDHEFVDNKNKNLSYWTIKPINQSQRGIYYDYEYNLNENGRYYVEIYLSGGHFDGRHLKSNVYRLFFDVK